MISPKAVWYVDFLFFLPFFFNSVCWEGGRARMRQTGSPFSCIIMCLSIWNNYTEITELRIYYFFNRTHQRNTDACLLNQTNNILPAFQSRLCRFVKDGTSGHKLGRQEWLLVVINSQHLSVVTKKNLEWGKCRYSPGEMIADSLDLLLYFSSLSI